MRTGGFEVSLLGIAITAGCVQSLCLEAAVAACESLLGNAYFAIILFPLIYPFLLQRTMVGFCSGFFHNQPFPCNPIHRSANQNVGDNR